MSKDSDKSEKEVKSEKHGQKPKKHKGYGLSVLLFVQYERNKQKSSGCSVDLLVYLSVANQLFEQLASW